VPALHISDMFAWAGVSVPEHEKPYELPMQPWTLESCLHVVEAFVRQQYEVLPFAPAVPTLQTNVASVALGESAPVHE
jgi:hypothetical protein